MNSGRSGHAGKTRQEKKAYMDSLSVPSPTVAETVDTSDSGSSTANQPRPSSLVSVRKRPTSSLKEFEKFLKKHVGKIFITTVLSGFLAFFGYLGRQVYVHNREIGEIRIKLNDVNDKQTGMAEVCDEIKVLGFKIELLWAEYSQRKNKK